jgi:membrane-associated protein
MLLGYFVGASVPWLATNVDYLILGLLALSVVPIVIEWWRHHDDDEDEDEESSSSAKSESTSS